MAYRRRRTKRKMRRGRILKRSFLVTRDNQKYHRNSLRLSGSSVYYFSRVADLGAISIAPGALAATVGALKFQLDQLPDFNDFTALFDQYKFLSVKLMIYPDETQVVAGTSVFVMPRFISVIDYDDAVVPSSAPVGATNLMQYQNVRIINSARRIVRTFKPHQAVASFSAGVFSGYGNSKPMWNDLASPSIEHYGFKYWIGPPSGVQYYSWHVFAKYTVAFKNVR